MELKSHDSEPTQNASPVFYSTFRDDTGVTCAHTSHIQRLVISVQNFKLLKTTIINYATANAM